MNIPEVFVLVPVEPTEEMLNAGIDQEWTKEVYVAMVNAAPAADINSYDEAKERELFESAYPLDNGVTWRAEAGNEGRYCVWIDCKGGFWACVNAAFGFQQKWEVWSKCAKSRARSAE